MLSLSAQARGTAEHAKGAARGDAAATWARRQVRYANRVFAPLGVWWVVTRVSPLSVRKIDSAVLRDRVGRGRGQPGQVTWLAPMALVDLDGHTKRHGVHWRDRTDRRGELLRRRWVIVARTPYPLVLAHELGHFFGLPHSRYAASLMNKRSAPGRPKASRRRFVQPEVRRMGRRLRALVRVGRLKPLRCLPASALAAQGPTP